MLFRSTGVTLPSDYQFVAGDLGTHTFVGGVAVQKVGLRTITATSIGAAVKGTANVTVVAGALSKFLVSGFPLTTVHNVAHSFTVIAQDAYGNTITNYLGTVQFTNAGGTALLPAPYTFTSKDKGKHVFNATFQTMGAGQSLTVADQNDPSITGSETGINVT